jgi:hypothetical protein
VCRRGRGEGARRLDGVDGAFCAFGGFRAHACCQDAKGAYRKEMIDEVNTKRRLAEREKRMSDRYRDGAGLTGRISITNVRSRPTGRYFGRAR